MKTMKKHELLEKAMRDYPKGTKFFGAFTCGEKESTGIFEWEESYRGVRCMPCGNGIVYDGDTDKWAEIIPEKLERVFIMKSEDGVDLYEGDKYWPVTRISCTNKYIVDDCSILWKDNRKCNSWDTLFSTKEAAEKWIEEQNKPKEVVVHLGGLFLHRALVHKEKLIIRILNGTSFTLSSEELEAIYKAHQSLQ